jgi:hypothetical protein
MKFAFIAVLMSLSVNTFANSFLIQDYEIKPGFNETIDRHLPSSVECTNHILGTDEFEKGVLDAYGDKANLVLDKITKRRLKLVFKPFVAPKKTLAATNMVGLIRINNIHNDKTLGSLTGTVAHESMHNLGFKHDDSISPDVSYTVGSLVRKLVGKGYCKGL